MAHSTPPHLCGPGPIWRELSLSKASPSGNLSPNSSPWQQSLCLLELTLAGGIRELLGHYSGSPPTVTGSSWWVNVPASSPLRQVRSEILPLPWLLDFQDTRAENPVIMTCCPFSICSGFPSQSCWPLLQRR